MNCCPCLDCMYAQSIEDAYAYDERNIPFGGSLISQRELDEIGESLAEQMGEIAA